MPARSARSDERTLHSISAGARPAGLRARYDVDSLDNRDAWFIEKLLGVVENLIVPYHRGEVRGLERIPDGGALYVGNHSGGSMLMDSFIFGAALLRARGIADLPFVLAHDFALKLPGLHHVFTKVGAVRASPENARRLFDAGHKVVVYPGGDDEALRPFRDRNRIRFGGHCGYVRLALRFGVPIVPVVSQGSHATFFVLNDGRRFARLMGMHKTLRVKSFPAVVSLPWGLTFFPPPLYIPLPSKIRVEIMAPITFDRSGEEAASDDEYVAECAGLVERKMQATLDRLASER